MNKKGLVGSPVEDMIPVYILFGLAILSLIFLSVSYIYDNVYNNTNTPTQQEQQRVYCLKYCHDSTYDAIAYDYTNNSCVCYNKYNVSVDAYYIP